MNDQNYFIIKSGEDVRVLKHGKLPRPYTLKTVTLKKDAIFYKESVILDPFGIYCIELEGFTPELRDAWQRSQYYAFALPANKDNIGSMWCKRTIVEYHNTIETPLSSTV